MAWLEKKRRRFLLVFRLNGSRYKKLLVPTDEREAEAIAAKVERQIEMLERGEWQLPDLTQVTDSLIGDRPTAYYWPQVHYACPLMS